MAPFKPHNQNMTPTERGKVQNGDGVWADVSGLGVESIGGSVYASVRVSVERVSL